VLQFKFRNHDTQSLFLAGNKEEEEKGKVNQVEEKKESGGTKGKENIQPKNESANDGFNIEDFLKQDIHNDFSQVFVSF
jgi:hypothetical protein